MDADGTMILAESTIEASATSAAQRYELDRGSYDLETAAAVGETVGMDLLGQGEVSVPRVSTSTATAAAATGAAMGAAAAAAGATVSTAAAFAAGTTAAAVAEAEEDKPYVEDVNEEELWREQKRGAGGEHPTITPAYTSGAADAGRGAEVGIEMKEDRVQPGSSTAGAAAKPPSRASYMGPAEVAAMSQSSSGSTALGDLEYGEDQGREQGRILPGLDRFVHGKAEDAGEGEGYLESDPRRRGKDKFELENT